MHRFAVRKHCKKITTLKYDSINQTHHYQQQHIPSSLQPHSENFFVHKRDYSAAMTDMHLIINTPIDLARYYGAPRSAEVRADWSFRNNKSALAAPLGRISLEVCLSGDLLIVDAALIFSTAFFQFPPHSPHVRAGPGALIKANCL